VTETPLVETDASRYATRRARRAAERQAELAALAEGHLGPSPISAPVPLVEAPEELHLGELVAELVPIGLPVAPVETLPRSRAPRPPVRRTATAGRHGRRPAARVLLSGFAMLAAAGLVVSLTLPGAAPLGGASASAAAKSTVAEAAPGSVIGSGQSFDLTGGAVAAAGTTASRDEFSAMTYADVIRAQYAGQTFHPTFVPTAGAIRWPFDYPVAISAPYGYSSQYSFGWHDGVDFVPGLGAPAAAIADGVVIWVGWDGAMGYCVRIQHKIAGQTVVSIYGHMISDSSQLYPGEQVKVGTVVGLTGQTGQATGPHLHLGITIDGQYTDPYVWLTINATNAG